jgi:hypothetical protein
MRQFNSESEFLAALGDQWHGADAEVIAALGAGVSRAEGEVRQEDNRDGAGLDLRLKGWVLRTEDVPVAEAIGIVAAALTAATGPVGITAAAVITAVSSFAAMCWKAWRKGAALSQKEIALLGLLRFHGPMTGKELASKAAAQFPEMTPGDVTKNLQSLSDVNLRDGSVVALVRRDASDRWVAQAT